MNLQGTLPASGDAFAIWLVDFAGNIAMSQPGLDLLGRIKRLVIPAFASTEHAMSWGSELDPEEHATLLDVQRTASQAALAERDPQQMVDHATQSQLLREAADAFLPGVAGRKTRAFESNDAGKMKGLN